MKFLYQGIETKTKQRVHGVIDASTLQHAHAQLREQEIQAVTLSINPEKKITGKKVKISDLVLPIQELATLTEAGVSLIDAIYSLAESDQNMRISQGFKEIAAKVEAGEKFSEAIDSSLLPFPSFVSPLVKAGELSGQLTLALNNASQQMEYEESIRADIKSAITYPLVLIGSGITAMLIIFFAVVPKFSHMLDGDKELPLLAYWVLSAGRAVNQSPFIIATVIALLIITVGLILRHPEVRSAVANASLRLPVIGEWLSEQDTARWAALSSAMLQAKVSLIEALTLAAHASDYKLRKQRALNMVNDIESGMAFSEALKKARLIPATSMNLIAVGDKTGQLGNMLKAVAKLHDESCKRRMKKVITLMEPIAILVVGIFIGTMIIGIILAITATTNIDI
ncbi:type II secretion system F family protein [Brumicola nitratireducens]|uniref:Type II secretion system protein n=1 Tax=Glaciecola nitratireducens (strain JCM 12485 / KCTC 12276 / FR1064) TaxID=1085623 RepID=G4QIP7_GLANF|nr:type II secretion system F family protein [Glaciecola nitratireducens]AEP31202.1 type II secretion system protein [Glaciecola nitratireducens FR1064]